MNRQLNRVREGLEAIRQLRQVHDQAVSHLPDHDLDDLHRRNEQQLAELLTEIRGLVDALRPRLEGAAGAAETRTDTVGDATWLDDGGAFIPARELADLVNLNDFEDTLQQETERGIHRADRPAR